MTGAHRLKHLRRRLVTAVIAGQVIAAAAARPAAADMPGIGIVKDAFGGVTGWAFEKVADGIARWVLGAVEFFVNGAIDFLRSSARPDVEAAWFASADSPYATVRNVAAVLMVGFVFLGLLQGLVQADPAAMVRRVVGNLPVAVAGMVVTTAVVGRLLELTDALSNAVLASSDQQALHFLSGFGASVTSMTSGFAAVLLGLVAVLAALLLWVELIVRSSLVYLLVAISPLGFAAMLWPSARGFLRKTVEILLAVILSKFVIAVALAIGVAALGGAGSTGAGEPAPAAVGSGLGTLLVGAVLLGLAAFSPFLVLKLVPVAEGALLAQGASRGPARAAQSGLGTYSSVRMVGRLSGSGSSAGGTGTGAATGGGPFSPPPRPSGPVTGGGPPRPGGAGPAPAAAAAPAPATAATASKAVTTKVRRSTAANVSNLRDSGRERPLAPARAPDPGERR